jgi:hypothetical protein
MPIFNPEKALRAMHNTSVILQAVLRDVSTEQAQRAFDGAGGWNVVEVVGHLNDWEQIFSKRSERMIAEDDPNLPGYNQEELVKQNGYAGKDLAAVLAEFLNRRRQHIDLLVRLNEEQWGRVGTYPSLGQVTLLEHATNISIHDVNHIEQIVHTLRGSSS